MIYLIIGILMVVVKGNRYIFAMLGLEMVVMGMIIYNLPTISSVGFVILLVFATSSSVINLVMVVVLLNSYGHEYVKF